MTFEDDIKEWVKLDNEIKRISVLLKEKRGKKQDILEKILDYKNENDLANLSIKITDGVLKFNNYKQYQPITFTYLNSCLKKIINDENKLEEIINYIKENRSFKVTEDIKRIFK